MGVNGVGASTKSIFRVLVQHFVTSGYGTLFVLILFKNFIKEKTFLFKNNKTSLSLINKKIYLKIKFQVFF
jgi:hypothetical protein